MISGSLPAASVSGVSSGAGMPSVRTLMRNSGGSVQMHQSCSAEVLAPGAEGQQRTPQFCRAPSEIRVVTPGRPEKDEVCGSAICGSASAQIRCVERRTSGSLGARSVPRPTVLAAHLQEERSGLVRVMKADCSAPHLRSHGSPLSVARSGNSLRVAAPPERGAAEPAAWIASTSQQPQEPEEPQEPSMASCALEHYASCGDARSGRTLKKSMSYKEYAEFCQRSSFSGIPCSGVSSRQSARFRPNSPGPKLVPRREHTQPSRELVVSRQQTPRVSKPRSIRASTSPTQIVDVSSSVRIECEESLQRKEIARSKAPAEGVEAVESSSHKQDEHYRGANTKHSEPLDVSASTEKPNMRRRGATRRQTPGIDVSQRKLPSTRDSAVSRVHPESAKWTGRRDSTPKKGHVRRDADSTTESTTATSSPSTPPREVEVEVPLQLSPDCQTRPVRPSRWSTSPERFSSPMRGARGALVTQQTPQNVRSLYYSTLSPEDFQDLVEEMLYDSLPRQNVAELLVRIVRNERSAQRFLQTLKEDGGRWPRVRVAWHLAGSAEAAAAIAENGICCDEGHCMCGRYGHGGYVACTAAKANAYGDFEEGVRQLFLVLALPGEVVDGERGRRPPCTAADLPSHPTEYCFVDSHRLHCVSLVTYRWISTGRREKLTTASPRVSHIVPPRRGARTPPPSRKEAA